MKYKVIGDNDVTNVKQCWFRNRGITDINTYTNLNDNCLLSFNLLENMGEAVELILKHINNNTSYITIVVDCDCDGYTSAAMLYNYLSSTYPETTLDYVMHTGKQHGLSEDINIPEQTTLIILPDGGTNDTEQCKVYRDKGVDILVLDHHIKDKENPYAVIVNNQCSNKYANKELCGAGVVYKFLQALDESEWNENADDYLDLVALGNIGDLMDVKSYETKRLIDKGLSSIKNKFISAMIKAQEYSMHNHINIHNFAFYLAPLINAMCRCGTMEDKNIVFRALIETDEKFDYKKRGQTETIKESIYDRAARLCKNTKGRQDKTVKSALPKLKEWVEDKKIYNHPIMFVRGDDLSSSFTGLAAIKLADYYNRPCLVLKKRDDGYYGGSARNNDNSPFNRLKQTMIDTQMFEFCQGHEGAFGFSIKSNNISDTVKMCKELFSNLDFDTLKVDFEIDFEDFDIRFIRDIDRLADYYGTGLKEPKVIVTNIILQKNQGLLMGTDRTTWKFITDDNIAFIKFGNTENDKVKQWLESDSQSELMITAYCEIGFNEYNGVLTPQAKIKDYEVI